FVIGNERQAPIFYSLPLFTSSNRRALRLIAEAGERRFFAGLYADVRQQAEHLEQLAVRRRQVREHELAARFIDRLDDAEQDRNAYAVDQLRLDEVDDDVAHAAAEQVVAAALDAFAAKLIEIRAGIEHRRAGRQPHTDFYSVHHISPQA